MAKGLGKLLAASENSRLSTAEKTRLIQKNCLLYRSSGSDGAGAVLFTGYYEPWLEGSRVRDARFKVPVYQRPDDMLTVDLSLFPSAKSQGRLVGREKGGQVVPYFSRGEITSGALDGKGQELLWLEDPVDLFFLQVQGSGRVTLEDGVQVRVQYDAQNGLPYRSLGKVLIERGVLPPDQVSMQAIRKYFQDHPEQLSLLNENASYTFFRLEDDGPFGNIAVALTPGRSIATDAKVFPKGAPALVRTRKPVLNAKGEVTGWTPFTRFVFNQDTGGAITGPGRVDLFWGGGPKAEAAAGRMKEPGELYFLLPTSP
jgi:membrane-bound lytic murein transglycosylase A